jgi:hypothetical protein
MFLFFLAKYPNAESDIYGFALSLMDLSVVGKGIEKLVVPSVGRLKLISNLDSKFINLKNKGRRFG